MVILKIGFLFVTTLYLAAATGLFVLQRSLQYFPTQRDPDPATLGLAGVTRLILPTPDGESLVLWYAPPEAGRPVILFLHGNAGEMADRAERLASYQTRGFGAAFLSWRGYGGSTGTPTESGLLIDARTAYDHLRSQGIGPDRIVLVGESLGTGPAVQLAARIPVAALVLEAPYSAALDIAQAQYPWLPVGLLMKDQYRSRDHIAQVRAPVLILHGEADRVIPFTSGQYLFARANEPKTFLSLGAVGHEALGDPRTWEVGARFIDQLFRSAP
ncbi:MAG: alpha/beta fold hydrolase [Tabrizicola sp.]|nr:alpha/beta fold hydrolase [Tabrizicola sp.]